MSVEDDKPLLNPLTHLALLRSNASRTGILEREVEKLASIPKRGPKGDKGRDGKDGKDGKDGVSIERITTNKNGDLVVTLSDGTKKIAPLPKPRAIFAGGGGAPVKPEEITGSDLAAKLDLYIGNSSWRAASFVEEFNGTSSSATIDHNLDGLTSTLFVHRSGYIIEPAVRELDSNTLELGMVLPLNGFLILT